MFWRIVVTSSSEANSLRSNAVNPSNVGMILRPGWPMNRGSIPGMSRRVLSSPKRPYRHRRPPALNRLTLQRVHKGCCWHSTTAHRWAGTWWQDASCYDYTYTPAMLTNEWAEREYRYICRRLLAVPAVNLCELLIVGHQKKKNAL